MFDPIADDHSICSDRCRRLAAGCLPEPLPRRRCALPECGVEFQPFLSKQRCCSELHGKRLYNRESRADGRQANPGWNERRQDAWHRRRAAKVGTMEAEPVDRDAIAERDGWRCQLCGRRVDPSVAWPDPMSRSLDHIVPLSLGGAHVPSNVQLAHLGCNSVKGNRPAGEQLRLIG